ncbi:metal ABC transporter permease, partial [Ectothiorhodospiraceae bacterium WFHF3C12]|nr:metal ABC transporter permease [Ectothiorhodospiraceae bacterium WFHF3C12]
GLVGGGIAAILAATLKSAAGARGNDAYGMMILLGWGATLLVAANTALGEAMAHALADGQLYFSRPRHLVAAAGFALILAGALPWLSRRLIRARFTPEDETANRLPAWRWHFGFDLAVAVGMALGTATIGLMAAFALVFLPAWAAFRVAPGWRWALTLAALIGIACYLAAFVTAMALNQPFGPVMVAMLLVVCPVVALAGRR